MAAQLRQSIMNNGGGLAMRRILPFQYLLQGNRTSETVNLDPELGVGLVRNSFLTPPASVSNMDHLVQRVKEVDSGSTSMDKVIREEGRSQRSYRSQMLGPGMDVGAAPGGQRVPGNVAMIQGLRTLDVGPDGVSPFEGAGEEIAERVLIRNQHPLYLQSHLSGQSNSADKFGGGERRDPVYVQDARRLMSVIPGFNWKGGMIISPDRSKAGRLKAVMNQDDTRTFHQESGQVPALRPASGEDDSRQLMPSSLIVPHGISPLGSVEVSGDWAKQQDLRRHDMQRTPVRLDDLSSVTLSAPGDWQEGDSVQTMNIAGKDISLRKPHANEIRLNNNIINYPFTGDAAKALAGRDLESWGMLPARIQRALRGGLSGNAQADNNYFAAVESANTILAPRGHYFGGGDRHGVADDQDFKSNGADRTPRAVIESYVSTRKPMQWGDKLLGAGQKGMAMLYKGFDFFGGRTKKQVKDAGIDMVYMGGEAIKGGEFFVKSLVETLSRDKAGRALMGEYGIHPDANSNNKYTWKPTGEAGDPFTKMTTELLGTEKGHAKLNAAIPGTVIPDVVTQQLVDNAVAAPFLKNKDYKVRPVNETQSVVSASGPGFNLITPSSVVSVLGDHHEANINTAELRRSLRHLPAGEAQDVIAASEGSRRIANSKLRALIDEHATDDPTNVVKLTGTPDYMPEAKAIMKEEYPTSERKELPYSVRAKALHKLYGNKSMDFDIDGTKVSIESPESLLKSSAPDAFGDERNATVRNALDLIDTIGGRDQEEIAAAKEKYQQSLARDIGVKMNKSFGATEMGGSITTVALQDLAMPSGTTAVSAGFGNEPERIFGLRFPAMNDEQSRGSQLGMSVGAARKKFGRAWDLSKELIGAAFSINGASWDTQVRDEDMDGDTKALFKLARGKNMDPGTAGQWAESAMVASGFDRTTVDKWKAGGGDINTAWQMMSGRKIGPEDLSVDTKFADFYSQYADGKPTMAGMVGKYYGEGGKAGGVVPSKYLTGSYNEYVSKAMTGMVDISNEGWNAVSELIGHNISQEESRYLSPALGGMKKLAVDGGGKAGALRTREIFKSFSNSVWAGGGRKSINHMSIIEKGMDILNDAARNGFSSEDLLPLFRNGSVDENDAGYRDAYGYVREQRLSGELVRSGELMNRLTGSDKGAEHKTYAAEMPIVNMGFAQAHLKAYDADTSKLPGQDVAAYIKAMKNMGGNNPKDLFVKDSDGNDTKVFDPVKIENQIRSAHSVVRERGGRTDVMDVIGASAGWAVGKKTPFGEHRNKKGAPTADVTPASGGSSSGGGGGEEEPSWLTDGSWDADPVGTGRNAPDANWGIGDTGYTGPAIMRHGENGSKYSAVNIAGYSSTGSFVFEGGGSAISDDLYPGTRDQFNAAMPGYSRRAKNASNPHQIPQVAQGQPSGGMGRPAAGGFRDYSGSSYNNSQRFAGSDVGQRGKTPGTQGIPSLDVLSDRSDRIGKILDDVSGSLEKFGENLLKSPKDFEEAREGLKEVTKALTAMGKGLTKPGSLAWAGGPDNNAIRSRMEQTVNRHAELTGMAKSMTAEADLAEVHAKLYGDPDGSSGGGGKRRGGGGGGGNPLMNRGENPEGGGLVSRATNAFIDNFGAAGWLGWAAFGFNRINNIAFGGIREDAELYRQDVASSSYLERTQRGYKQSATASLSEQIGQYAYSTEEAKLYAGERFADYKYGIQGIVSKTFSQGTINSAEFLAEGTKGAMGALADSALGVWTLGKVNSGVGGFANQLMGKEATSLSASAAAWYASRGVATAAAGAGAATAGTGAVAGMSAGLTALAPFVVPAAIAGAAYLFREPIAEASSPFLNWAADKAIGSSAAQYQIKQSLTHGGSTSTQDSLFPTLFNLASFASGNGSAKYSLGEDGNFELDRSKLTSYSNGAWVPNDRVKPQDDSNKARSLMMSGSDIRFGNDESMVDFIAQLTGHDKNQIKSSFASFSGLTGMTSGEIKSTADSKFKLFAAMESAGGAEQGGFAQVATSTFDYLKSIGLNLTTDEAASVGLAQFGMPSWESNQAMAGMGAIRSVQFRSGIKDSDVASAGAQYSRIQANYGASDTTMAQAMNVAFPSSEYNYNFAVQHGIREGGPAAMTMNMFTGRSILEEKNAYFSRMRLTDAQDFQDWSAPFQRAAHNRQTAYTQFSFDQGIKSADLGYNYSMASIGRQRGNAEESFGMQMAERGISKKMMDLNLGQQTIDMNLGRDRSLEQRTWQDQDFSYGREVAGIKFSWQQEDFGRNIRLATGRQKRQMMREQERGETLYGMDVDQAGRQVERRDESRKWEDEDFQRKKGHFEESKALQIELFDMQTAHMARSHEMQMENIDASIANAEDLRVIDLENRERKQREMSADIAEWDENFKHVNEQKQANLDIDLEALLAAEQQAVAVGTMSLAMSKIVTEDMPEFVRLVKEAMAAARGGGTPPPPPPPNPDPIVPPGGTTPSAVPHLLTNAEAVAFIQSLFNAASTNQGYR